MERGVQGGVHAVPVVGFGLSVQDVEDAQQVIEVISGGVIQKGVRGVGAVDLEQVAQDDALAEAAG